MCRNFLQHQTELEHVKATAGRLIYQMSSCSLSTITTCSFIHSFRTGFSTELKWYFLGNYSNIFTGHHSGQL